MPPPPRGDPRASTPALRAAATALGVCGLLLLLTWTLVTDPSHVQVADFPTDTWLMDHQADSLRQAHLPSLFLHSDLTAFYPVFAFYGGTLFAFAGAITILVGSAVAAQVVVYVLALAAAYGGWLWLGRMAGLRSWRAHAPAILYVTAPYVLTNIYVRQDLTESVATAAIPLLIASALSVLRADRLHAGPASALAISTIALGGSHNLTLLWGATLLGATGLALAAAVPQARHMVTRRGLLRVLAIAVPAMAVNAWYLLPDLAYQSQTVIAQRIDAWRSLVGQPGHLVDARYLFTLGRPSGSPGSGLTLALPVLAMAWTAAVAVSARRRWREPWARTLAVCALATLVVLLLMTHPSLILWLPDPWLMLQFSYRLESFALLGICGAVLAALVLARGGDRRLTWLLLPILALSVAGAVQQRRDAPRSPAFRPPVDSFAPVSIGDFADARTARLSQPGDAGPLLLARADVDRDRADVTLAAAPGDAIATDLIVPPQLIDVHGARVIGRWAAPPADDGAQHRWSLVLRVDDDATPGHAHITIREARTLPIVGGRVLSLLGLLGLAANAAAITRARRRRRLAPCARS